MNDRVISKCPSCGEGVQPGWKICPFCETRLQAAACPQCGFQVQLDWRHCPQCEALLICPQCATRVPQAMTRCPKCQSGREAAPPPPDAFIEEICGMEMVYISGGSYEMGDHFGDGLENELPVHKVRLDAFQIGRCPVTQEQWLRLQSENPSRFEGGDLPVEQVTWGQARDFARQLTLAHNGRYRFDLPTEAQWEYAARSGGRSELYAGGDDINKVAWYENNSNGRTHPVGAKGPNGLGLYDMSGNVWEWCRDSFGADAYACHSTYNPLVDPVGADRVIRGGSWNLDAWSARCARRFSFRSDMFGAGLGFRLVMVAGDTGGGVQHKPLV
jgi:formylglycine-generating enzyme required for sulfatase activity